MHRGRAETRPGRLTRDRKSDGTRACRHVGWKEYVLPAVTLAAGVPPMLSAVAGGLASSSSSALGSCRRDSNCWRITW